MPRRDSPVHVVTTTRVYKDRVYKSHLLRRSYREDGKVKNQTVGNLSHLPDEIIDLVRRALRGESFAAGSSAFEIVSSRPHGAVQAVTTAMQRLGFAGLLAPKPSRERDLVTALVAARILEPASKLATTRWWSTTSLAEVLGVADATEDDLYAAMDWLLARQPAIEKKLAARHLHEDGLVLYDLTSSYFEGERCPLAKLGYSRDGKKGTLQITYGLLTDGGGCPVAVSVYSGNTGDSTTLLPQIEQVQSRFGIRRVVLVGDRGMISEKQIRELRTREGVDWVTALKSPQIRELLGQGAIQLGLFDERNLFEMTHPDYPGERLVVCRNPEMARRRKQKREALLSATAEELERVRQMVGSGRLLTAARIGVRVGRVINKYKVAKHFALEITDASFAFTRRDDVIAEEAALDGLYVIRTSVAAERIDTADAVRTYKRLSAVERAFRSLKTIDLKIRPIHHHLADRVRAHVLLCMLAYYVEWHMLAAWRELLFADEDQAAKATRDPVAPAKRSAAALHKVQTHQLADGTEAHSFRTLLRQLSTIARNTCRPKSAPGDQNCFTVITTPQPKQRHALQLLEQIRA
jgi:transposase